MRLRAVMLAANSKTISGAIICTLEFVTVTGLPAVFSFPVPAVVCGMKNSFVEARCEFCGGPESSHAPWLSITPGKLVEMRT